MSSNLANDDSEMMRVPTPEQEQVRAHSRQHDQLVAGAQTRHARRNGPRHPFQTLLLPYRIRGAQILDHEISFMSGRIIFQEAENPEPRLFVKTGRLEIEGIEINGVTLVLQR
jgi:hypothetical protein